MLSDWHAGRWRLAPGLPGPDRLCSGFPMNLQDLLGGLIALFLGIYLLFTLLRARGFDDPSWPG